MAIQSFSDEMTEEFFFTGELPPKGCGWVQSQTVARRKLDQLNVAGALRDLRVPPNNRWKALKGDMKDWYSIRINRQWRVIFIWTDDGPEGVAIVDYH